MNDPLADDNRRDRAAQALLPFCHPRAGEQPRGKKETAAAAALTAGIGSGWERMINGRLVNLLQPPDPPRNPAADDLDSWDDPLDNRDRRWSETYRKPIGESGD